MNFQTLFQRYAAWIERSHRSILLVSLIISLFGFWYSGQLYKNLRTDIEELLPASAPSVQDLKKATGRFTGLNHLEIVIESDDAAAAKRLQIDIAKKLSQLSPEVVAKVKNNIRTEREFFEKRKSLYIDLSDWRAIADYVHDKIRAERKKAFSLGIDDEEDKPVETFSFSRLRKKYSNRSIRFANFKDDYFQSKDGHTHIVLAFLPGKVTEMSGNERLSESASKIIQDLNPKSYASDMVVGLGGDVQNMVEEHHGLVNDLVTSFVIVTAFVTLVLFFFYRSVGAVTALSLALFAGTGWTFGLSYFLVGYLNANTAFLGSIVLGNGINFGIILMARYLEDRRQGISVTDALSNSMYVTARPTLTAALAAACSYGSLMITNFRGFNQFGVIGAVGMALCWIASYTIMPALIVAFEKRNWIRFTLRDSKLPFMRTVASLLLRTHVLVCVFSVVLAVAALMGVMKFSRNTLESDLSKLRNKESLLHGSGYWGRKVDDAFNSNITPTMVLTNSHDDALKVYAELKKIQQREGTSSPFSTLNVVDDFIPQNQAEKLELMKEVSGELTPKVLKRLKPEELKRIDEFLPKEPPPQLQAKDLPPDILANFTESDGKIGTMVNVYPRLNKAHLFTEKNEKAEGTWNGEEVIRYTALLREAIHNSGVSAVIAGQPPISADMLAAISVDGPKATLWAFLLVMILVILMFPNWRHAGAILGSLWLGVLWMGGVMAFFGWKINFLNFITLPITFGIGVDYAVNILGRIHEDKEGNADRSILSVVGNTGGAVLLCSSTTIIGYSSLLISGSQAFTSFGRLAVLGELTCITAAIIALPAFWLLFQKLTRRAQT